MADTEVRLLARRRRFNDFAVTQARRAMPPIRTEVVKNNESGSYFCRYCRRADSCEHVTAVRRFESRAHMEILR